jgi:hypothetical protein
VITVHQICVNALVEIKDIHILQAISACWKHLIESLKYITSKIYAEIEPTSTLIGPEPMILDLMHQSIWTPNN